jgi:uncharacterized protein
LAKQKIMVIGRESEKAVLEAALQSKDSELIAVYGRRRVGKTFLIREFYRNQITFEFSGLYNGTLKEHMAMFADALIQRAGRRFVKHTPASWFDAFGYLARYIERLSSQRKKVIFLDEMPWMATNKSRFLTAFENFWNGWASKRKDVIIVICGSAASWMINKIERNKGGLYNRVTKRLHLKPFSLQESAALLRSRGVNKLSHHQLCELYMVLGGVPHYLKMVEPGETPNQAIDRLCFKRSGILKEEFNKLFEALFAQGGLHKKIVEVLAKHKKGLQRNELIKKIRGMSGGGLTMIMEELIASGFVTVYIPFDKKNKDKIFKLTDPYALFYLQFMAGSGISNWNAVVKSTQWISWSGLAFENICQYHAKQIVQALGLGSIDVSVASWVRTGNKEAPGAQVDLLIDRADNAINICEIKFNRQPFVITKKYASELQQKLAAFVHHTKTSKTIFCTFITSAGLLDNQYSFGLVQRQLAVNHFFTE